MPPVAHGAAAIVVGRRHEPSCYALSPRLVQGIRSISQRLQQQQLQGALPAATNSDDEQQEEDTPTKSDQSLVETVECNESTYSSLAHVLAWTVFAHVPLQCCRSNTVPEAARYLGSFVGEAIEPTTTMVADSTTEEEEEHLQQQQHDTTTHPDHADVVLNGASSTHAEEDGGDDVLVANGDESDSLAEIFAQDSDGSDYEFESDWDAAAQLIELRTWADQVQDAWDPVQMSVPVATSWEEVATAVSSLLQTFTYTTALAALSMDQYKTLQIPDRLTQLILALLVPSSSSGDNMFGCLPDEHWQRLGLHVLNVFRDATLHQTGDDNTASTATYLLEEYLRLVRILLQVDHHRTSDHGGSAAAAVAPASLVGLSALSALCSEVLLRTTHSKDKKQRRAEHVRALQGCVVDSCDDLTELLEKSHGKSEQDVQAMQWIYLAAFQVLIEPPSNLQTQEGTMPTLYGQTLLNSGLFRQWLLFWSKKTDDPCRKAVQETLLDLSIASPTLLGKYAWRFPDLAQRVTQINAFDSESLPEITPQTYDRSQVDVLLWNLYGMHLIETTTGSATLEAPKVQWRSKKADTPQRTVTLESCQSTARMIFQGMCQCAIKLLVDWKLRREHNLDDAPVLCVRTKQYEVLSDFRLLSNRLSNSTLHSLFVTKLVPDDGDGSKLREELRQIQRLLSNWPVAEKKRKPDTDSQDIDEDAEERQEIKDANASKPSIYLVEQEEAVNTLRRSIKTIQSALDSCCTAAVGIQQLSFSSKLD
jgi:hypothetical protein